MLSVDSRKSEPKVSVKGLKPEEKPMKSRKDTSAHMRIVSKYTEHNQLYVCMRGKNTANKKFQASNYNNNELKKHDFKNER